MPPATTKTTATAATTAETVLLYVPNLIGYARVVMALASFAVMMTLVDDDGTSDNNEWTRAVAAVLLYVMAFAGDLFDGMAARRLGQTSSFGGVLDMVTDRCSTLGLLAVLGYEYSSSPSSSRRQQHDEPSSGDYYYDDDDVLASVPPYWWRMLFLTLQILDVSSHWCQMMQCSLDRGGEKKSHHKSDDGNAGKNFLVRWYYKYVPFFAYCCVGAEFTYVLLYVRIRLLSAMTSSATATAALPTTILVLVSPKQLLACTRYALLAAVPGCVVKQFVNAVQLTSNCYLIARQDADEKNRESTKQKVK